MLNIYNNITQKVSIIVLKSSERHTSQQKIKLSVLWKKNVALICLQVFEPFKRKQNKVKEKKV